jgi:hypothetical protein
MAKKSARSKKKTFSEFKAWLQGVEAMQASDWVPDSHQWSVIRKELNNVIPDEVEVEVEIQREPFFQPAPFQMPPIEQPMLPPQQRQPPPQPMPVPTAPQSGDSTLDVSPPASAPARAPIPSGMKLGQPDANVAVKTANIDTSDGKYESSFL